MLRRPLRVQLDIALNAKGINLCAPACASMSTWHTASGVAKLEDLSLSHTCLQDYEETYYDKYGRSAKLVRKATPEAHARVSSGSHGSDSGLPPLAGSIIDRMNSTASLHRDRSSSGGPMTSVGLAKERCAACAPSL